MTKEKIKGRGFLREPLALHFLVLLGRPRGPFAPNKPSERDAENAQC